MIVLVSLRMGCLTLSAIAAIGAGVMLGFALRDRWRTPRPLVPIAAQVGESAFNAEIMRVSAMRFAPVGAPADEPTQAYGVGWSRFVRRFEIGADECITVVVAARDGHAAPKYAGLFNANGSAVEHDFDQYAAQYGTQPTSANVHWLYVTSSEGLAASVAWCAHAPRSVEARVMFRTIDGFSPPRRADVTARWQVLRAPWAAIAGPRGLHVPSVQRGALAALAAEFTDPLGAAQREPPQGLSESAPSLDLEAGAAALIPVNTTTAIELYSLAARDSGIREAMMIRPTNECSRWRPRASRCSRARITTRPRISLRRLQRWTYRATFTGCAATRARRTGSGTSTCFRCPSPSCSRETCRTSNRRSRRSWPALAMIAPEAIIRRIHQMSNTHAIGYWGPSSASTRAPARRVVRQTRDGDGLRRDRARTKRNAKER